MKTSLLQLFAINDQEDPDIGSDLLDIVEVPDGEAKPGKMKRMKHWLQHVHLLGSQARITFDLLFIDIRFMRPYEAYAPKYGMGEDNPMGLLHALTFAARQDPSREPLVWGYHSAEPLKVCNDPVAIIAFSLLAALEQRGAAGDIVIDDTPWKWDDFGINKYPKRAIEHFSTAIAHLPQGDAEVIWKDMVFRYRNKLAHYVKKGLAFIEYDDLEGAYQLACENTEAARKRLAKLTLEISGKSEHSWRRVLQLQSLFADQLEYRQESWPEDKIEVLKEYLMVVRASSISDPPEVWAEKVAAIMTGTETAVLNGIRPKGNKNRIGAMAIVCWWLKQKSHHKSNIMASQLLRFLGYEENGRPVMNCLYAVTGYKSLEKFLEHLETTETPLQPSLLYDVGRYWWENKCNAQIAHAPKCIQ
ncbi:MAG TPA: hypothetical protein VE957_07070 [Terriglobales bacterium]|nr:hypothetical protein [Gemmataceae bacterium]HYW37856.1 hypothetical protein [Terriglobales bacterium]